MAWSTRSGTLVGPGICRKCRPVLFMASWLGIRDWGSGTRCRIQPGIRDSESGTRPKGLRDGEPPSARPILPVSREAAREPVEHPAQAPRDLDRRDDLVLRGHCQASCELELRLAFGLRTQRHDDEMSIRTRAVLMSFSDV